MLVHAPAYVAVVCTMPARRHAAHAALASTGYVGRQLTLVLTLSERQAPTHATTVIILLDSTSCSMGPAATHTAKRDVQGDIVTISVPLPVQYLNPGEYARCAWPPTVLHATGVA